MDPEREEAHSGGTHLVLEVLRVPCKIALRADVELETRKSLSLLVNGIDTKAMSWVLQELKGWLEEGEEA